MSKSPHQARPASSPKPVRRAGSMKLNVPTPTSRVTPTAKTSPDLRGQ